MTDTHFIDFGREICCDDAIQFILKLIQTGALGEDRGSHTRVTIATRSQERHKILKSNSRWQHTPQLIKKDRIRGNLSAFSYGCHDRDDVRCIICPSQTYLTGMTCAVT